jgi:hypothetical protein
MADLLPFTTYIRIVPQRGNGKRFEIQRSREKIATKIYNALIAYSGGKMTITLVEPGGSATDAIYDLGPFNTVNYAAAVKPQMGEFPDTVTVAGFCTLIDGGYTDFTDTPPYATATLISASADQSSTGAPAVVTGPPVSIPHWFPTSQNEYGANLLRAQIQSTIGSLGTVYFLDFNGIKYGWGGKTFAAH